MPQECDITDAGEVSAFEASLLMAQHVLEDDPRDTQNAALEALEAAAEAAAEDGDLAGEYAACRNVAVLHKKGRRLNQCLTARQRLLELAKMLRDPAKICRAHYQLGMLYFEMGQSIIQSHLNEPTSPAATSSFHNAIESFEALLTLGRALHDRAVVGKAHKGIGLVAAALGNPQQASEHLSKFFNAMKEVGTAHEKGVAAKVLADTFQQMQDQGLAYMFGTDKDIFERQVELRWEQAAFGKEAGDLVLIVQAYYELGFLMENSGSYTQYYGTRKAIELYTKCVDLAKAEKLSKLGTAGALYVTRARERIEALSNATVCTIS